MCAYRRPRHPSVSANCMMILQDYVGCGNLALHVLPCARPWLATLTRTHARTHTHTHAGNGSIRNSISFGPGAGGSPGSAIFAAKLTQLENDLIVQAQTASRLRTENQTLHSQLRSCQ